VKVDTARIEKYLDQIASEITEIESILILEDIEIKKIFI
jgi:hypothetical protein